MMHRSGKLVFLFVLLAVLVLVESCSSSGSPSTAGTSAPGGAPSQTKITLILGAYTTPREAFSKIIPLFQKSWKDKNGQDVEFQESYLGSGAQSRAIVGGFEADIAALSLESDITRIADAGLVTNDWKSKGPSGMMSDSIVVIATRKGNPKGIKDWADLAQKGLDVLTPDPKTSGGAQWNVMAMFGAAKRGFVQGVPKDDDHAAQDFVKSVFKNVSVLDKGARESISNFEKGIGDIAITYENEVLVGRKNGQDYPYIIPRSTILIENPVAVVDKYADKHGVRVAAEAFREFLWTKEAQRVLADYGLRSVDADILKETKSQYTDVQDLFQITYFGGWGKVTKQFFSDTGVYSQLLEQIQREKNP